MNKTLYYLFTLLLVCAFYGCGYTTDRLIREDMGSVYISYFENDTRRQGLEVDLRRALSQEIKLHGGMTIDTKDDADSFIDGQILDYSISAITRTTDDDVLMKRITVHIRYRWVDGLSGRELLQSTELRRNVYLAVGHQEAEAVRAFQDVAQDVIESLERRW